MRTNVRRLTRYDWLWIGWLVAFAGIELTAAFDAKKGNTFSEGFWWFIKHGQRRTRRNQAARIVAVAVTAWIVAHLWSGGKV